MRGGGRGRVLNTIYLSLRKSKENPVEKVGGGVFLLLLGNDRNGSGIPGQGKPRDGEVSG